MKEDPQFMLKLFDYSGFDVQKDNDGQYIVYTGLNDLIEVEEAFGLLQSSLHSGMEILKDNDDQCVIYTGIYKDSKGNLYQK